MKVIDLLNKIANGEEVPSKFIYVETEYSLNKCVSEYCYRNKYGDIFESNFNLEDLNDEIEIIEEPKKIEKLIPVKENQIEDFNDLLELVMINQSKLNEIIDYIKKGE